MARVNEAGGAGEWSDRGALIREVCRRIRLARGCWDRHENNAARRERSRALALYLQLTSEERDRIPQVLRIWLRYRSERYFGGGKKGPGGAHVRRRLRRSPGSSGAGSE